MNNLCEICGKEPKTSSKAMYGYSCVDLTKSYGYKKAKKQGRLKAFLRKHNI